MARLRRDKRRVFQETERLGATCSLPKRVVADVRRPVLLRGVGKTYENGVVALGGVDLGVARGELVALVGPSGCGKSTLLNLVGCIDLPSVGSVEIDGVATSTLRDDALTALRRDRIGTVFQFFNLLPTLSVRDNVALPLVLQRVGGKEVRLRVDRALESVGIRNQADASPTEISGGQLQRAAIARAIVHEPAIVLADEPTGNLDSRNGEVVLEILRALTEGGQAILMATHSADAAARADRRVHMRDGRIERIT